MRMPRLHTLVGALVTLVLVAGPLGGIAHAASADHADAVEVFARDVFFGSTG